MGLRRQREMTPSRLLARRLSEAEIEFKTKLITEARGANMNQSAIATKLGVDRSAISRFERSDSNPSLAMIRHYAWAIGAMVMYDVKKPITDETDYDVEEALRKKFDYRVREAIPKTVDHDVREALPKAVNAGNISEPVHEGNGSVGAVSLPQFEYTA